MSAIVKKGSLFRHKNVQEKGKLSLYSKSIIILIRGHFDKRISRGCQLGMCDTEKVHFFLFTRQLFVE